MIKLTKPDLSKTTTQSFFRLNRRYQQLKKQLKQAQLEDLNSNKSNELSQQITRYHHHLLQSKKNVDERILNTPTITPNTSLPLYQHWDEIVKNIQQYQVTIICGETGSGKTTQIPQACLSAGLGVRGKIAHTQPRRLAAKTVASRIAQELKTELGNTVGYKVRFDERQSRETTILLQTDGMLLAEIQKDRFLNNYEVIIIDEAHERSLNIDFLLGYLKNLLPKRPDLKVIITSATIDPQRFAKHFEFGHQTVPIIYVEGKTFPVMTLYRPLVVDTQSLPEPSDVQNKEADESRVTNVATKSIKERDMIEGICSAIEELDEIHYGDTLIFFPTERDIREAQEAIEKMNLSKTEVLSLFSRQTAAVQSAVFQPKSHRRIILSTNVAETSVTVPRILNVIDTGLVRVSRYSHRTKIQSLPIEPISQASANQRKGRCGRIADGVCIRLYSETDFLTRDEFTDPEIKRTSLATVILQMAVIGLGDIAKFPFVEPPEDKMITDGYKLLYELKAVNQNNKVTDLGRRVVKLSIDPRLAVCALYAQKKGVLEAILPIICGIAVGDFKERSQNKEQVADMNHRLFANKQSDFLFYSNVFSAFYTLFKHSKNQAKKWAKKYYFSFMRMREWVFLIEQLADDLGYQLTTRKIPNIEEFNYQQNEERHRGDYQTIHESILVGFLDYIGSYQSEDKNYLGIRNKRFYIFPGSFLFKKQYNHVVCAEIVASSRVYARQVAKVDFAWLVPLCNHLTKTVESEPVWIKKQGNVFAKQTVLLYGLPLISGRLVPYAKTHLKEAHEIFIQHGLVENAIQTTVVEIAKNRDIYDKLLKLEEKSRSRDILIDEIKFAELYEQILPDSVYSEQTLKAWYSKASEIERQRLGFKEADFLLTDDYEVDTKNYPNALYKNNQAFPLSYVFDPASVDDGITVTIPLASLNTFTENDFDYLVPALLKEKITALIKSLPKRYRRQFVPVAPYVDAVMDELSKDKSSQEKLLLFNVINVLQQKKAIVLEASWFDESKLDKHYLMNIAIKDKRGKVIAKNRSLATLKSQFCDAASDDFSRSTQNVFDTIYCEDFPEKIVREYVIKTKKLVTFPALVALKKSSQLPDKVLSKQQFKIALFDTKSKAIAAHRVGVVTFLKQSLHKEIIYIKKRVINDNQLVLGYQRLVKNSNDKQLLEDVVDALLLQAYLKDKLPYNESDYQSIVVTAKKTLILEAQQLTKTLCCLLKDYHQAITLSQSIFKQNNQLIPQLNRLVYAGFISKTPAGRLPDVARYLKGYLVRLDKAKTDRLKDTKWQMHTTPFENQLVEQIGDKPLDYQWHQTLLNFAYLLEEYKLSVFAQGQVKVSGKVSAKRLEIAFSEIKTES